MSYLNELTPQQLRNFTRRCRFTACGEPCDVFSEPTDRAEHAQIIIVTVNRYIDNSAMWLEADGEEISPDYLRSCKKVSKDTARRIISHELHNWAELPDGTVTGWSPDQIAAEADRIARG